MCFKEWRRRLTVNHLLELQSDYCNNPFESRKGQKIFHSLCNPLIREALVAENNPFTVYFESSTVPGVVEVASSHFGQIQSFKVQFYPYNIYTDSPFDIKNVLPSQFLLFRLTDGIVKANIQSRLLDTNFFGIHLSKHPGPLRAGRIFRKYMDQLIKSGRASGFEGIWNEGTQNSDHFFNNLQNSGLLPFLPDYLSTQTYPYYTEDILQAADNTWTGKQLNRLGLSCVQVNANLARRNVDALFSLV